MLLSPKMSINESWIDYNGHLNMAYYHVLFEQAAERVFCELKMGEAYARQRGLTNYSAELHVCYIREVHLSDMVYATFQILDFDEKRMRFYQELRHIDGWLAATSEQLSLHIDMSGPKVVSFPSDILEMLEHLRASQSVSDFPCYAGRSINLNSKEKVVVTTQEQSI